MLYIRKGSPLNSVSQKTAEIKRRSEWRDLPMEAPQNRDEAAKYTRTLRTMFEEFPKADIRTTIVKEQHNLCAYCMRRIRNDGDTMRIEHWYPLNKNKEKAIEYSNFIGACTGIDFQNNRIHPCCDNSKSQQVIKLNPCDQRMMNQIRYESDGSIYFEPAANWSEAEIKRFNDDINNVLNLNGHSPKSGMISGVQGSELKAQRKAVYSACKKRLRDLHIHSKATVSVVQSLVDEIENKEEYPEFAGVMLFYYKRWLNNHV